MARRLNMTIQRGVDFRKTFRVRSKATGAYKTFAGYSMAMQVRETPDEDGALLLDLADYIDGLTFLAQDQGWEWYLSADVVNALDWEEGYYQFILYDEFDDPVMTYLGKITVQPRVAVI